MPGDSASSTETATPLTSGRLSASSSRRIWPSGWPSLRRSSTWAPNFSPPSFIPFSTAFHQSELLLVMNIEARPGPGRASAVGAAPAEPGEAPVVPAPPQPATIPSSGRQQAA